MNEVNTENKNEQKDVPVDTTAKSNESADEQAPIEEAKYENGQLLRFVRIRFPGNSKSFPFLVGDKDYTYGQQVVAMSDRGLDIGYINSFPYYTKFREAMLPLKSINKAADKEDFEKIESMKDRENEAETICKELIEKHKLEMDLTHVELIQFGKKAVFYFIAPKRVDFRELVKDLVSKLKLRVELRQISIRDRAAALGGIGPCGRELCCSTFLGNYGRVNIKMAKNQNMALNPTRLNGLCGQLKCCLSYEDNVYTHKRQSLPKEGDFIAVKNGDIGKVLKLHILILQFDMLTDKGAIRRYTVNQFEEEKSLPKGWKFPDRFDHVTNETSTVIGKDNSKLEEDEENALSIDDEIAELDENLEESQQELEEGAIEVKTPSRGEKAEDPAKTEKKADDKPKNNRRRRNRYNKKNNKKHNDSKRAPKANSETDRK